MAELLGVGALVAARPGQTRPGREGLTTTAVLFRVDPAAWTPMLPSSALSLSTCGLPLALACRQLSRLGRRRTAWAMGAGLPGPLAIAAWAVTPPGLDPRVADHAVEPSPEGSRPAAQQDGVILPPGQTHGGRLHVQGRPPALSPRRSSSPSAMRRL